MRFFISNISVKDSSTISISYTTTEMAGQYAWYDHHGVQPNVIKHLDNISRSFEHQWVEAHNISSVGRLIFHSLERQACFLEERRTLVESHTLEPVTDGYMLSSHRTDIELFVPSSREEIMSALNDWVKNDRYLSLETYLMCTLEAEHMEQQEEN